MFPARPNAECFVANVKAIKKDARTFRVRNAVVGAMVNGNGALDFFSDLV